MLEGAWYNDAAAPKYRYLYNGKELHEEFGLNFYDYGARWYDPGVGSWWELDPMAETSRRWSPYVYGNDNPLRFIDPDGRETTAYGGFTSFAEMAARHEAAAEANTKPRDDEGCPPHCLDTPMAADATRTTDKVTPQIAEGSVQLPNFEKAKLFNGDSKLLPHEKAGVDGVVLGLQIAGSEIALPKALRGDWGGRCRKEPCQNIRRQKRQRLKCSNKKYSDYN